MHQDIQADYQKHVIRNRRRSILKKIVSVMACLVVFCTTYALILPAITMENQAYCGEEEHVHSEECYSLNAARVLICGAEDFEIHSHSVGCYTEDGLVSCGMADYLVHSHSKNCYDANEQLVCTLAERSAHVHTDDCYIPGETQAPVLHVHREACYTPERGELVCEVEEYEGHAHSSGCYTASEELNCVLDENHVHGESCYTYPLVCTQSTEPHSHSNSCYGTGNLLCGIQNGHIHGDGCWETVSVCDSSEEGHEHGENCYNRNRICSIPENHSHEGSCYESVVVCGREEGQSHSHNDGCYSTEAELVCEKTENHIHSTACYRQDLTCTTAENPGHTHADDCYQWNSVLSCGLEEGEPEPTEPPEPVLVCMEAVAQSHVHGDACFVQTEPEFVTICGNTAEDHIHTAECYEKSCGLTEHTHTMPCWSDPEADVESPAVWKATFAHVELTGNWNADVIAIAETQLGYAESTRNYTVWEDGTLHGYTRYGHWYGSPHGDWCAMFTSFCLHYAGVEGIPLHWGVRPWIEELTDLKLYHEAEVYEPKKGDIIFYDWEGDDLSDHVGLVAEVIPATDVEDGKIKAIEGNSSNCVQYVYYDLHDERILGYSELPDNIEVYSCGILRHRHNEYCYDGNGTFICRDIEHQHTETCIPRETLYCGLEDHSHGEVCYNEAGVLVCELTEHTHTEVCTVEAVIPVYYCDMAEHSHIESCYDEAGELVCKLTEHTHSEECTIVPPTYYCGLEEHTHVETCYNEAGELVCELTEHTHTEVCTVEAVIPVYYCDMAEHSHIASCYDEAGELVCELTEHTHSEECTIVPPTYYCGLEEHTHVETCYNEAGELVCELTEHTHTDVCTVEAVIPVYYCNKAEHSHIASCYDEAGELVCELTEHTHSEECTIVPPTYYCGLEEHTHVQTCYNEAGELVCEMNEHAHTEACILPAYYCDQDEHTHSESCYNEAGELVCELTEHAHTEACTVPPVYLCGVEEHKHGEGCYDAEGNLICTIPEHTHSKDCTVISEYICGLEEHVHDENCYDNEGNLTCTIPEHTHTEECKPRNAYACGMDEHTHGEGCYDAEGNLICTIAEHVHTLACVGRDLYYSDATIRVHAAIRGVENLPKKLALAAKVITPEENPDVVGSVQVAVSKEVSSEKDRFVNATRVVDMQLISEGKIYELPETAIVKVTIEFADPIFAPEDIENAVSTTGYIVVPENGEQLLPQLIVEEPEEVPPTEPEIEEEKTLIDSVMDILTDAMDALAIQVDATETDAGSEEQNSAAGEAVQPEEPAVPTMEFLASAVSKETYGVSEKGMTSVTFETNRISTFAVALASTTQEGTFWERVTSITSGGTYMIVSAEGNYGFVGSGSGNAVPLRVEMVKGHPGYYTIERTDGNAIDKTLYWTITASGNNFTVRSQDSSLYLRMARTYNRPNYTNVFLDSTSTALNVSYETPENCWRFKNGNYYLRNAGTGTDFSMGTGEDTGNSSYGSADYYYTADMLIFKLSDVDSLNIINDVEKGSEDSNSSANTVTKPAYDPFINPTGALNGDTAVTSAEDRTQKVSGKYYSDPATSKIEQFFRVNTLAEHYANDGRVLTDKSVIYGKDDYKAFSSYSPNTFSVTLSALGQSYKLNQQDLLVTPLDVVFIVDTSSSMSSSETTGSSSTRIVRTKDALNSAMAHIFDLHKANRVGVVVYSRGSSTLLPLDRYKADDDAYFINQSGGINNGYTTSNSTITTIKGSNTLKSESGVSYAGVGDSKFQGFGTYTQAGIAQAYEVFKAADTTYTYIFDKDTEAEREYTVKRQPIIILLSDGEPTYSTNLYNDVLNGPHYGDGNGEKNTGSGLCNNKGIHGFNTILSANYYKRMVGIHYDLYAQFFTVGMEIAETTDTPMISTSGTGDNYKRAVLNPTVDIITNLASSHEPHSATELKNLIFNAVTGQSIQAIKTYWPESNLGAPHTQVPVLKNHPYSQNYSYADGAYFGLMDTSELTKIFTEVVDNSQKVFPYGFVLYQNSSVRFTDRIGHGMEMKGGPVLRYLGTNYAPTGSSTAGNTTTYTYNYSVTDTKSLPNRTYDLSKIEVTVVKQQNGTQVVNMYVPDRILPTYIPSENAAHGITDAPESSMFYYEALPVRLIYQVGLTAASEERVLNMQKNGEDRIEFYTNQWQGDNGSVDEDLLAFSTLLPDSKNPFYFDEKGEEHYTHHPQYKTENTTGTYDRVVNCYTTETTDTIFIDHVLGNNGKLVFEVDSVEIPVEKVWDNSVAESERDAVTVTLYKVVDKTTEAGTVNQQITEISSAVLKKDAENTANSWKHTFDKLAPPDGFYYAIAETQTNGFQAFYSGGPLISLTIGNAAPISAVKIESITDETKIIVTNTPAVELPKTGGAGTIPYHALGMTLIAMACALYIKQKKSKKERGYV